MNHDIQYGVFSIALGLISLYLGLAWKKPTYGGGIVRKYGSIVLGFFLVIYGIILCFKV